MPNASTSATASRRTSAQSRPPPRQRTRAGGGEEPVFQEPRAAFFEVMQREKVAHVLSDRAQTRVRAIGDAGVEGSEHQTLDVRVREGEQIVLLAVNAA